MSKKPSAHLVLNPQYPSQYPITLTQTSKHLFTVTYGGQVKTGLNYPNAAKEIGECIMHALACDSMINNE